MPTIPIRNKPRTQPEFEHQCALFTWARNTATLRKYPALDLLSCSLNGVKLTAAQAGKAKAAGMLKGEYDVKLPVARGGHIGLIIEMKAGRNTLTPEQEWYGRRMEEEGWKRETCWTWEQAQRCIVDYLSRPSEPRAAGGAKTEPGAPA